MTTRKERYGALVRGWDWRTTPERLKMAEVCAIWLGYISKTAFLEMCIDKVVNMVYLTEDNAGGLMIGNPIDGWWDVTPVQKQSSFVDDAAAVVAGDTGDWTVDWCAANDCIDIVATYDAGRVAIVGHYGRAAQAYLRKTEEEFDSQWASA